MGEACGMQKKEVYIKTHPEDLDAGGRKIQEWT
jgi:hypothetical protein